MVPYKWCRKGNIKGWKLIKINFQPLINFVIILLHSQ